MEPIAFQTDEGEVLFYVLEETRVSGVNYLLVAESEEDEAECYILKDTSDASEKEANYEMVEDDETLDALSKIFAELLEQTEIRKEEASVDLYNLQYGHLRSGTGREGHPARRT